MSVFILRASSINPDRIDIKIIEQDRQRAELIAGSLRSGAIVLHGDALDGALLEEAQVGSSETVVAVTNDDETNIFASVLAKQLACKRAITLVNKPSYGALMPTLGINSVVSPSAVTISTVLQHVRHGPIAAIYSLREDFGEIVEAEITASSRLTVRPLDELGLPPGFRIGLVVRDEKVFVPLADTRLREGDHIIALVTYSYLRLAEALLGAEGKRIR